MITVPTKGSEDVKLDLRPCYSFRNGDEYEITLDTVLTVFVGESYDAGAELFPLRLPVSATARFRW